ncbi:cobalamin biosynthesis protein [Pseudomonas capeferrum]|uniref:cobalamin biosynthesis protein n=1 Tax=Pseudomonas capeferrum TaxID=1495066 RepID=UPI0015E2DCFF|nr:cobalamin biosynthesis protein [Pseudomonas capeferrum]MBA1202690.1 cobalamin biosynthesis protein [Pseudomonas capeferrum]
MPSYIGLGCRRGCPVDQLEALLRATLRAHGLSLGSVRGLASIDLKADENGLHELAERLRLPLVFFPVADLVVFESRLTHRSPAARAHSGCWGVAESAALALASRTHGPTRLQVPRQVSDQATLALACPIGLLDNHVFI